LLLLSRLRERLGERCRSCFSSDSIAGSVGPALSLLPQCGSGVTVAPLPPALLLLVQNAAAGIPYPGRTPA